MFTGFSVDGVVSFLGREGQMSVRQQVSGRPFCDLGCVHVLCVQYAHGLAELRPVARHPKFKTEVGIQLDIVPENGYRSAVHL